MLSRLTKADMAKMGSFRSRMLKQKDSGKSSQKRSEVSLQPKTSHPPPTWLAWVTHLQLPVTTTSHQRMDQLLEAVVLPQLSQRGKNKFVVVISKKHEI